MRCNDLYNKILNIYDNGYIQKNIITQCSTASDGDFFVINDNKKKVSLAVSFDKSYKKNEEIYAEFIKVDRMIAWNLKMYEVNSNEKKLILLLTMILKGKHYNTKDKKFFSENMIPLFVGSNFERMQKKYL